MLLALAAVAGATTLTYLYDRDAPVWPRLCAGVCLGFAALGLVGFVLASLLGMTPSAVALTGVVCASPLLLLGRRELRARVGANFGDGLRDLNGALTGKGATGTLVFYAAAAVVFWMVFSQAMYETPRGIFTGVDTNIGDLPFHLAVVTGFAYGENFPPQHPEFAGVPSDLPVRRGLRDGDLRARGGHARRRDVLAELRDDDVARGAAAPLGRSG